MSQEKYRLYQHGGRRTSWTAHGVPLNPSHAAISHTDANLLTNFHVLAPCEKKHTDGSENVHESSAHSACTPSLE